MKTIKIYLYIRALLFIPASLACIYDGVWSILEIPGRVEELPSKYGAVDSFVKGSVISESEKSYSKALILTIESETFFSIYGEHKRIIEANIEIGDTVLVYSKNDSYNKIKALKKGDCWLIPFESGGYWVSLFFIMLGFLILIISVRALFRGIKSLSRIDRANTLPAGADIHPCLSRQEKQYG